jgi:septal ring factor EnvC (AmiA/AmiB activator)
MKRVAPFALAVALWFAPSAGHAQDNTPYEQRRRQLVEELEQTQSQLAETRQARVQLEAQIDRVIAEMMERRAETLLLSNEANALQQLDAVLTASQDNLLQQRDRFLALGDAVRRRSGAQLVVLLRADSSGTAQTLSSAELIVDGAMADTRTYSAAANNALQIGAVDQIYRADVLPTPHSVVLTAVVNGQTLSQTVNVTAQGQTVTYVQFAVRNGQLVPVTWTSRGTTPF